MSKYSSGYVASAYQSGYSPVEALCDGCPGTDDMQSTWDGLSPNELKSTVGTTLPDHIVIAMFRNGPAPARIGTWTFDATAKTVTHSYADIMTGAPTDDVYPVSNGCIQTCRDTFDYWYNL